MKSAAARMLLRLGPLRRGVTRLRRILRNRNGRALAAAGLTLLALTALRAADPAFVGELKERTFDAYQRLQPRPDTALPVRIVDIDEAAIAAFGQWPWPRTRLAALTKRIGDLGAGVVAFDMLFPEPDRTTPSRLADNLADVDVPNRELTAALLAGLPDHDALFADAIAKVPTVLGFAAGQSVNAVRPPQKAGLAAIGVAPAQVLAPFGGTIANIAVLQDKAAGIGGINVSARDRGGIVRRMPMLFSDGRSVWPNLAIDALRVAQGQRGLVVRGTGASGDADTGNAALVDMRVGDFKLPLTADGEAWLYLNRDTADRYVSARDVLDPAKAERVKPLLDGGIVLIGTSAAGLLDQRATPLGETMPGVTLHAQLIEQILAQQFLARPDWADGLEIVAALAMGLLVTGLVLLIGARFSLYVGLFVLSAVLAGSWLAFSRLGLLLDPVYPSLATLATYIAVERVLHVASDRDKKFVRQAFGQYLAPELLARLEKSPEAMQLGGESRDITVMFMDVRGFTPLSEQLDAHALVDFINTLLAPLSDAIQEECGTIDKFIGDSIMAFWNAPLDIADHPARACRAALAMRAAVAELNADDAFGFAARGFADPVVRIGVGLTTGVACVGNMGSQSRFNYSAMGDVVNTAARLESATKGFRMDILVSHEVAQAVPDFALLEAGEIALKGKALPVKVYALIGDAEVARSAAFADRARLHARLMAALSANDAQGFCAALRACRSMAVPETEGLYDHFERDNPALSGFASRPVA